MVGRRDWMTTTAGGLPLLAASCAEPPLEDDQVFPLGVASGDPSTDGVVLWTALGLRGRSRKVGYEVFADPELRERLFTGRIEAGPDSDWTARVELDGLSPGTSYWYRFEHGGARSPVGRTRTLPEGRVEELRVAVVSCASYAHGFFHVYREVAERADIDVVLHLGDYIYEYASEEYGARRAYDPPHECVTLSDYRRRYRQYRRDADLQALHQQHPVIALWDDHEIADNGWREGALNHQPHEGLFPVRRAAATRAFHEYLPLRSESPEKVWRDFRIGDLVDLWALDTRGWGRDAQVSSREADLLDPGRQLLGADQEQWVLEGLTRSSARWKVLAQQIPFAGITVGPGGHFPYNFDQWDGYSGARQRLLEGIAAVDDVVLLAGDIHSHWAMEVAADPFDPERYDPATGEGAVAVELVTSSVTTPTWASAEFAVQVEAELGAWNPHVRHLDFRQRGWLELTFTPEEVVADFHVIDGTDWYQGGSRLDASMLVRRGASRLVSTTGPGPSTRVAPPLAPNPPPRNFPGL